MKRTEHNTLATRLVDILQRLNNGERLRPEALAEEFKVSLRTIQRDLKERLGFLPLENAGGGSLPWICATLANFPGVTSSVSPPSPA
ncbi:hypothetical protein AGMMS49960_03070 [Betaproteobacteria bacterium]|nr:hypothetical protein AGMMS49543_01830 [Betaproteobacteria bacterium]GHT98952.1 hypothetical protein AGMMS49960_03070 [Betaproteobacteria bacterium]GHU19611.1 hypothetical protein AGMMS50243_12030 [Betaproteobacteria bacterium]